MKKWAKIVELNNGDQSVIVRRSDDEHGEHITIMFTLNGCNIDQTISMGDQTEGADAAFEGLKMEFIQKQYDEMLKLMTEDEDTQS